jgi:hypothetical protein
MILLDGVDLTAIIMQLLEHTINIIALEGKIYCSHGLK